MRELVLQTLYRWFPFDLRGDCAVPAASEGIALSCVINFYGRINLLEGILYSLQDQDISRDRFEIVLVEDQGGTEAGCAAAELFSKELPIRYSFSMLKSRYPMLLWLLVVLNCTRHAPLYLLPVRKFREMGRFGVGFLAGVVTALFKKEGFKYS